jgi:hypothetical protein
MKNLKPSEQTRLYAAFVVLFYSVMFVLTFIAQLVAHSGGSGEPNPYWHGKDWNVFWERFLPDVAKWSLAPTVFFAAVGLVILIGFYVAYVFDKAYQQR